ncbi:SDR family oxidoreductase [Salinispirillum sp. LH 10-3-1]|uniref:SDR family oxidoreductase n=1 Tax=Salinispirillum sp. LH 10-3-1 TaxID=2952525 RepID=A0AB38YJE7_9GAMM
MQIKDAVIAITGGGQGLGRAMALLLARHGARLALIDLNEEQLDKTAAECQSLGADAHYFQADISQEAAVELTFTQIVSTMGRLDVLVNNAGIMRDGLLVKMKDGKLEKKMSLEQFNSVIQVNLTGTFLCGREAAAIMAEQGSGLIINIASVSRAGNMGQTNYSASKAGVSAMVVTWAKELGRYGVRVAGIAPGAIATDMTAQMKPEALKRMEQWAILGRLGEQDEIAHSVQYIIENDFYTGRILEIDGGTRV